MMKMIGWLVLASFISVNFGEVLRVPLRKKGNANGYLLERKLTNFVSQRFGEDLSNYMNTQYYGKLGVGTPEQSFEFMFDTGSSDAWVLSSTCGLSNVPCLLHWNKYNHNKSKTYESIGKRFVIPYVQGTIGGFLSVDKFTMGNVTIKSQHFGEIDSIPLKFIGMKFEGIIGLGFLSLSVFGEKPFFYQLLEQNPSMKPIFSFYLGKKGKNGDNSKSEGELLFGDVDSRYFKPPVTTVPVVSDKYWAVKADEIRVGNLTICANGCVSVIDSGTSLILGPFDEVNQINLKLGAQPSFGSIYLFDCEKTHQLSDIEITIGGKVFSLSKEEYIIEVAGQCMSALMGLDTKGKSLQSIWIFGDVFFRKYYTAFDLKNRTISFAEAVVP